MRSAPGQPRPVTPTTAATALVAEAVAELSASAAEPAVLRRLQQALQLLEGHERYPAAITTPASDELAALEAETARFDWRTAAGTLEQEMLSGHLEGALLALLVSATGARRVLEIGMFTGYAALAMAEALPDGPDSEVVACELDEEVARFAVTAMSASPAHERVRVELGPAADTLERLADHGERFDLVFLDADKTGYPGYVRQCLDLDLLRPGGLLCVDNAMMGGEAWSDEPSVNGAAVAETNRLIAEDRRLRQVIVPIRDGLTLAWRRP